MSVPALQLELHDARANWPVRLAIALGLACAFALIAHNWRASQVMLQNAGEGAHNRENRFAQQQASTTSSSALGFLIVGALGAGMAATAQGREIRWVHPLSLLFLAYIGWCCFSISWTESQFLTSRKLTILLLLAIGGYGTAMKGSLQDLMWAGAIYLAGSVVVGGLAELSLGSFRPWRADYRFAGTSDPNGLGLEAAALALVAWFLQFEKRDRPYVRYALIALGIAALMLTKSRTSLAALTAAAMVAFFLRARGQQRFLLASAAVTLACVVGLAANFVSVSAVQESADVASMGRQEHVSSLTGRLPLWQAVSKEIDDAPWRGHGFGAFWSPKRIFKYSEMFKWQIPHAHNTYLDLVLATGFIGLALYLLWIASLAIVSWRRYERSAAPGDLLVACLVVFTLVHGAAESKIPSAGMTTYFLFALGASIALKPSVALHSAPIESPQDIAESRRPALIWTPTRRLST